MSARRYAPGEAVRVRWLKDQGHIRIPWYIRGKTGVIEGYFGTFLNPEDLAFGRSDGPAVDLYRVRFRQSEIWPRYEGPASDQLFIEIYEPWLEPAAER